MPGKTLAVLGSGPGIGVGVASAFSVRGFTHIALVSRDKGRLAKDEDAVLDAIQERGYSCVVKNWACDLTDFDQLSKTLAEIEKFGQLECVLFNAARVAGLPPLEESIEQIENDFRLTNLALYKTAEWAIPLLQKAGPDASPSFFVTSTTLLYKEPVPDLVSLSLVKSRTESTGTFITCEIRRGRPYSTVECRWNGFARGKKSESRKHRGQMLGALQTA
jgi:NAD(P)-dependent dehydrogenase (short-subunit alcohol dehydrogenase family)